MSHIISEYNKLMNDTRLSGMDKAKAVTSMLKRKSIITTAPINYDYDKYGSKRADRLWSGGFYPEIKLLYNERPTGDPNAFAKAIVSPESVVVSDLNITSFSQRTRALSGAINKAAKGHDLIIVGNILDSKLKDRWDLIAEFINDLRVKNMYLILGPNDIFSMQDYIDFGFNFVTDRAEKTIKFTKLVYTYFPIPIKKNQINIHGHPSDNMYNTIEKAWHYDASPIYNGRISLAVNTLKDILEEAGEDNGKDIQF